MATRNATAEAFAVSGDRITSVGTNKKIKVLIGPSTRVIDAQRRLVLPGFNDAHVHFLAIGNSFSSIDLRAVKDAAEMSNRISRYARFLPKGRWILGGSWNAANWPNNEQPVQKSIDGVTPDNPVFLYHADGKSAFANSVAFRLARLKMDDPHVDRDASGAPTGIVRLAALRKIASVVPVSHTRNWIEIAETATKYAASLGVTSVQDMHSDDSRDIYRELERLGKLKTRVYDCVSLPDWKKLGDSRELRDNGEMVRGGCLKGFSDGDEESKPTLLRDILVADKAGLQIMVHAIGNSAIDIVLSVFEQTAKANGRRDRRFRVEHAHNPRFADVSRFGRTNIIASMQPYLFVGGAGEYYSSLLKQNAHVAFGSDASITDFNPLLGIHAAVTANSESISVYDAVHAYTVGSAYAEFQERQKGTTEVGKLADFVILSDDIFAIDPAKIGEAKVVTTVVAGRVVYQTK